MVSPLRCEVTKMASLTLPFRFRALLPQRLHETRLTIEVLHSADWTEDDLDSTRDVIETFGLGITQGILPVRAAAWSGAHYAVDRARRALVVTVEVSFARSLLAHLLHMLHFAHESSDPLTDVTFSVAGAADDTLGFLQEWSVGSSAVPLPHYVTFEVPVEPPCLLEVQCEYLGPLDPKTLAPLTETLTTWARLVMLGAYGWQNTVPEEDRLLTWGTTSQLTPSLVRYILECFPGPIEALSGVVNAFAQHGPGIRQITMED